MLCFSLIFLNGNLRIVHELVAVASFSKAQMTRDFIRESFQNKMGMLMTYINSCINVNEPKAFSLDFVLPFTAILRTLVETKLHAF